MKVITWNIQWGRGLDGKVDLARIVAHARTMADFDVLCLQEVADNFPAPGLEGNDERDQFAELASLLPTHTAIEGYGVDVSGVGTRRRRFGNILLSRYRVIAARRHLLPWPADPGKETMPRVAVEALLETPMGPMRVTTTHLEYYSDVQRRAQALRLRELHDEACARFEQPSYPTAEGGPFDAVPQTQSAVLVGDFNFPAEHPAYEMVQRPRANGAPGYVDAWGIVHGRRPHVPTFCVFDQRYSKTPYCCDFAFVSAPLRERVRSLAVDSGTKLSDHQPLLLEIDDA